MKYLLLFLFLNLYFFISAQNNDLDIWYDRFSYNQVNQIAEDDVNVYCASEIGIFFYNKEDGSVHKLSKIHGLSDVKVSAICFDKENDILIVGYENGNLDLVTNDGVENYSHLKQKIVMGEKSINSIVTAQGNAYLATSFGIVVFDVEKREFKDSYVIGDLGQALNISSIVFDLKERMLYASSEIGVHYIGMDDDNLADYNNWNMFDQLPRGEYKNMQLFQNKLYFNKANDVGIDTVYVYTENTFTLFKKQLENINSIRVNNNRMIVTSRNRIDIYDENLMLKDFVDSTKVKNNYYNYSIIDDDLNVWIATMYAGMYRYGKNIEHIQINGPLWNIVSQLHYNNGAIYGAFGRREAYQKGKISIYDNGWWGGYWNWEVMDVLCIAAKNNSNEYFYGTAYDGFVKSSSYYTFSDIYSVENGRIPSMFADDKTWTTISSLAIDDDNVVWMTNWAEKRVLTAFTPEGVFYNFTFPHITEFRGNYSQALMIDSYGRKWAANRETLIVYDENGTIENTNDDFTHVVYLVDEEGSFANTANVVVEDLDNKLWIGTDQGIATYSNYKNVFDDESPVLSRPKVEEGDDVGYLLGGDNVLCIAIDGGNRKWVGTEKSGVFLISADGQTQLKNFTVDNSPLISNNVYTIAIHEQSGEIFFGTDAGVISYKSDATTGEMNYDDVYIYPNPIKPDYNGLIYINGLKRNTTIKITDVSGNLVYETVSNGGTATWDGNNLWENRVATGVYLLFCTDENGEDTTVKKLLFIN